MKRYLVLALVGVFLLSLVPFAAAQNGLNSSLQWEQQTQNNSDESLLRSQNRHCLTVNNQVYGFGDAGPVIKDGRCLIPIRAVSSSLGAEVDWDEDSKTVTISLDDVTIEITIDEDMVTVYRFEDETKEEISIDVPAQISNCRAVVPLRLIAEVLGYDVGYNSAARTVAIDTRGKGLNQNGDQQRLHDASCITPQAEGILRDRDQQQDRDQAPQQRLRDGSCQE